jgi:hypothetical protein
MPIEIKEIIVRTTVTENSKPLSLDLFQLKKMKTEIIAELKKEIIKTEKRKKRR